MLIVVCRMLFVCVLLFVVDCSLFVVCVMLSSLCVVVVWFSLLWYRVLLGLACWLCSWSLSVVGCGLLVVCCLWFLFS